MTHPLKDAQAELAGSARETWGRVEAETRAAAEGHEHAPGARLVFHGLDPTVQREHPLGRAIVLDVKGERFVFPLDEDVARRVARLREVQTLVGWPIGRENGWHVIAEIRQTTQVEPTSETEPTREHEVVLHDIYVVDQMMVTDDGTVPGFGHAMIMVDAMQQGVTVMADATPTTLVAVLTHVLATHHWRAFVALCDDALSLPDKRMAFEQFCQAWQVSGDTIALESIDGDPTTTDEGGVVRTLIKRTGQKGEAFVRPLRWIRRGPRWRYAGGIL